MKNTSKAVKAVPVAKMNPITKLARALDLVTGKLEKVQGEKFAAQLALAEKVLTVRSSKRTTIKAEHKRLIAYAKGVVAKDGYVFKHDKNVWAGVSNIILMGLAEEKTITIARAGKEANGKLRKETVKVKSLPKTAKSVATHASAVRVAAGMSDKRKANTGKTRAARVPSGAPQQHSTAVTAKSWDDSFKFGFKTDKASTLLVRAVINYAKQITDKAARMGYIITIVKK